MDLTPSLCRAARGLIGWTADDLAASAKIGVATVRRFELGEPVKAVTLLALMGAFEGAGIEFIPAGALIRAGTGPGGPGVRLR